MNDLGVAELRALPDLTGCRGADYVCLFPGHPDPAKRWPAGLFARVGDAMAKRGFKVVIADYGHDLAVVKEVAECMTCTAITAPDGISFQGLATLVAGSRMLVTNEKESSAAWKQVPCIILFFAADSSYWRQPLDGRQRVVAGLPAPEPEKVIDEALDLLSGSWGIHIPNAWAGEHAGLGLKDKPFLLKRITTFFSSRRVFRQ